MADPTPADALAREYARRNVNRPGACDELMEAAWLAGFAAGVTARPLFRSGDFRLSGGARSWLKIDCDGLADAELATLARLAAERLPAFGSVEGVPTGGLRFAEALRPYVTTGPALIADDVLTTGASMERQRGARQFGDVIGVVIFARAEPALWVTPLFTLTVPPA